MLIQVQFIKRELLIATTALGQLARENELNLRMMATVPAFLVAWGSFRAGDNKYIYHVWVSVLRTGLDCASGSIVEGG